MIQRILLAAFLVFGLFGSAAADETCQSPFLPKVTGQEDYIYVWTLGVKGLGDGNDSMVTVDANPKSPFYGKMINRAPVPGRHEAHHAGFTDDRRYLWAGGLDTSQIFVFDVGSNPAKPKLVKTISTFVKDTGGMVGPHTFYALPGRMLISALSNVKDGSGRTGLAEYSNDGKFIRTIWMPKEAPYGYDVRVNVNLNRMLTSSFSGKKNYMRPFGELVKDGEAMKNFGGIGANLPVDISIAPDDSKVYVNSFGDGTLRVYDVTNPFEGKLIEQVKLGEMANMVSSSWDGKRLYATNSLLSQWDKPGDYWLKAYAWEDGKLVAKFTTDFNPVGRAHIMNLNSKAFGPRAARSAPGDRRPSTNVASR